jgi:hypothetical protein
MKKQTFTLSAVFCFLAVYLTGCEVVGGIFKAGMVWGIILSALVVFGLIYLISRGRNK